jgi:hypothetical protein
MVGGAATGHLAPGFGVGQEEMGRRGAAALGLPIFETGRINAGL